MNAHATSTPRGDAAELMAIKNLLHLLQTDLKEWNLSRNLKPMVTANKSHLGHMISASGSAETTMTCLSLQSGQVPGILNLNSVQEEEEVNLLKNSVFAGISQETCRRLAIKNSFGFGGTNATIILAEYKNF